MATTSINRENTSPVRTNRKRSNIRTRKAFCAQKCNPYAFLNEPIKEIACSEVASEMLFNGEISWESNLLYLEASVRKWCELHSVSYEVEHSDNPHTMIYNLYAFLRKKTDDYRFDIDFIPKDGMLKIMEYRYCDFPDHTIFYLPARYINDFESAKMRELMLRFFAFIIRNTLFLLPEDSFDFAMQFDVPYDEIEDEEGNSIAKMVNSYHHGEAKALFDEIYNVPFPDCYPSAIRELISSLSDDDKMLYVRLIENIEKGLQIMIKDDLRNYSYFEGYSSDPRFDTRFTADEVIFPERLFVICYDNPDDDPVASNACYSVSEEANNYELQYFRDAHHLSPEDTEVFEPSTYP
ncbi:MAG: hypothetical protein K2H85_02405, partial [Allobaculum sp.]|nr:hypothetical protein [Allobaculum sp.]